MAGCCTCFDPLTPSLWHSHWHLLHHSDQCTCFAVQVVNLFHYIDLVLKFFMYLYYSLESRVLLSPHQQHAQICTQTLGKQCSHFSGTFSDEIIMFLFIMYGAGLISSFCSIISAVLFTSEVKCFLKSNQKAAVSVRPHLQRPDVQCCLCEV